MIEPSIVLEGVSKSFRIYHQRHTTLKETLLRRRRSVYELLPVLDDISLEVPAGQALGIIGRNGAGKSTSLKVISGLMPPDRGVVTVRGRISTLLELGAGFQGDYSGTENIYLYAALMGLRKRFVDERFDEIVEFSGIGDHLDNAVKTYSSGMYMRLAFAVAVHVDPDVLMIDEVLAVGDEAFQRRCYERALDLRARGKTICLVSHDLDAIQRFCDRVVWLDRGVIRADGNPADVVELYRQSVDEGAGELGSTPPPSEVSIERIQVFDSRGLPADAIRSNEPGRIQFTLHGNRLDADGLMINLGIFSAEAACLVFSQAAVTRANLEHGAALLSCTYGSLPLAPGSYRLEISAHLPSTSERVSSPHQPSLLSVLGRPGPGLLSIPILWDPVVSSAAAAPEMRAVPSDTSR